MAGRWLRTVPLLVLAYVVAPAATLTVARWTAPWPRSAAEPGAALGLAAPALSPGHLPALAVGLVLFALAWWRTSTWPLIALVPMAPLVMSGVGFGSGQALITLVGAGLAWGTAWLAGRAVSRPVTAAVGGSAVEIVIGLRGGARLRVQSRRLLLDRLPAPNTAGMPTRLALPLDRVEFVQAGGVAGGPTPWQLPNSAVLLVPPGPVVRIVGGGQQWLLPVDDADAVAAALTRRVAVRARPRPAPPEDSGRWHLAKTAWKSGPAAPRRGATPVPHRAGSAHGRHLRLVVGALMVVMGGYSTTRLFAGAGLGHLFGVLLFGVAGLVTMATWYGGEAAHRLAEENPRPRTAPGWGETDPAAAPVPGWLTHTA
ncbi:hypothetical protein GCM10022243_37380 [Saccharothrix violaceirubra]|uniref:Uncharacterized protein n=1 Tax=Saccharothrix violaceirubra TaxID=413306 RepID=A0A7W7WWQ3_9PSEU|nr:hypothetical protein [Saccharothrix violaceirubra]MBB4966346.1 hypothetical protein [Saccharothrix violaceirubra]